MIQATSVLMGALLGITGSEVAHGQIKQNKPLDILRGLKDGSIQATSDPVLPAERLARMFDGNHLTEAVAQNTNTLALTLHWNSPVRVAESRLFFWTNGSYSLEVAHSEADLIGKTGTYRLLVNDKAYAFFKWDSVGFAPIELSFARIAVRSQVNNVVIGEWVLEEEHTLTSLYIQPKPLLLVPNASLQLSVKMMDESGNLYPYTLGYVVQWSSSNPSVASIDDTGLLQGIAVGTSEIRASATVLTDTAVARVVPDFVPPKAPQRIVKVALVMQDPIIDPVGRRKIHEVWRWSNPTSLANQLITEFSEASDGVVQFQIVEIHDDQALFSRLDGQLMTLDTLAYYFNTPGKLYGHTPGTLQYLAEDQNRIKFDYHALIDYYDFANKRNNGLIDEVWVYAFPFCGMWESQLVGPNAFWWNSPPLGHPGLEKLLSIMGLNYERGIPEAMESFGHRMESALWKAFGRWNVNASPQNDWELFTTIDKDRPGKAQVGTIHYPPNGMSDYDWGNRRTVVSYADNWKRYPYLFNFTRSFNCSEWGCSHLGYMRWWYRHLPHSDGVTKGVLNNWWHYWYDYEGAVELAEKLSSTGVKRRDASPGPEVYSLEQNYPNPFNASTKIAFSLARSGKVTLVVYDLLAREVQRVLDEWRPAGRHEIVFDGSHLATGIYLYRISAGDFQETKKFLLLK